MMLKDLDMEKNAAWHREHSALETLELVTKQMAAAVARCSRDFRYLWANQAYVDWLQCPLNEVVGHPIVDVLGKVAFESLLPHFNRVLAGEKVHYEQKTNFKGIGRRWTSATYTPTLDANRTVNGWVAVVLDITERKRAEYARLRLAALVESSEDAIISKNLDGIILNWNAAAQRLYGYTEAEVVGKPITVLVPPELVDDENEILKKASLGEHIGHYETVRITKTGNRTNVSLAVSPIRDSRGRIIGLSSISRDINERKRTAEALRKSEERFRLAARAGKMFAYEWDVATDVVVRSADFTEVLAIDEPVETTGQQVLARIHPDDRERLATAVAALTPESPSLRISYRMVRGDGANIWVERNSHAHFDEHRKIVRIVGMVKDVTERRLAEERLRESEEQFRTLAEAIPQLCWMARGDGFIFWYNQRWYTYTGTTPEQMEGWGWQSVHDPQTLPSVLERWKASISTGEPFDMVFPLRGADGIFRPFLTRITPIKDADGRVIRWFGTNTDITELRDAQERLRASEERLRLAQKVASMGTFEWNMQTGVNVWTPELEAMYGLAPGGFRKTESAFENLVYPDDRGKVIALVNEALKTGRPNRGEWRVIWPDGSLHWIAGRWQAFMNESGEPSRMVGVNVDITDRKLTEERLREYERAVEGAEEMIIVLDRHYRYLIANRQFLRRQKKTREQVIGHCVHELTNKERFEALFKPKLDECFQGKVVRFELKYRYPELGERDLAVSYFPVEGPNGIDRAACVLEDITDRKQAELALAGMTQKLIEAEEQERARIGRELHDDISQRLGMLAIGLDQLQRNPSEIQSHVQKLREQTAEISTDVQALSHELHSSKIEYLGVGGAMRSWCREFGDRQRTSINFRTDVSSVLSLEVGVCLFRVLQEALHNAVKHSGAKQIEVQLAEQPNQIHLIVTDSGKGFDIETAMRGRGLGLTSMQERVRLANGTINIQSRPMGGTTIHASVPLQPAFSNRLDETTAL